MIKIVVIGEKCLDKFVYTKSTRLSPEAPVPVLIPVFETTNDGMSGNVVSNLKSLIPEPINIDHFYQKEDISKIRYVDNKSNHIFVRIDIGEENISSFILNEEINHIISKADIVIVSDYNKGFLSDNMITQIGKLSKLSILDSKRKLNKEIIQSFTFIKLNENEAFNNKDLLKINNILITIGSKGCSFNNKIYSNLHPQETIDVSGAGDTFTSAFIFKYYKTNNIPESIHFANEMASIVVSKRGVTTIN